MAANRVWRGDAIGVTQIVTITPGVVTAGVVYALSINGKLIEVTATASGSPSALCTLFVSALNSTNIPEFREIIATTANGVLTLTSKTAGVPFKVAALVAGFQQGAAIVFTIANQPTGGTWHYDFGDEIGEGDPAYNVSAATLQTAFDSLFGSGNTLITKTFLANGDWQYAVLFQGTLANTAVPAVSVSGAALTGGNAVVEISTTQQAVAGTTEVQQLDLYGVSGGTMVIGYKGSSATVAYNVSTASLQTTMRAFASIGGAHINVTGTAGTQYIFTGAGDLAHTDVDAITFDGRLLTGTISASIAVTTAGVNGVNETQYISQLMTGAVNQQLTLKRTGTVSGGTFKFSVNTGGNIVYSADLDWNAKLYQIVDALEAAIAEDMGTTYGGPYFAPWHSAYANLTIPECIAIDVNACAMILFGNLGGAAVTFDGTFGIQALGLVNAVTGGGSYSFPGTGGIDGLESFTLENSGAFTLSYGGQTTAEFTLVATSADFTGPTAAEVQAGFEGLSSIGAGNVLVTKLPINGVPYAGSSRALFQVVFTGELAGTAVSSITGAASGTAGFQIAVATARNGEAGVSEVQTLSVAGSPSTGTFTLNFSGQETSPIAYNASAVAIKTQLIALNNLADNDILTSGGPLPGADVVITSTGSKTYTDVPTLVVNDSGLKGIVSVTTPGVTGLNEIVKLDIAGQDVWSGTVTLTIDSTVLDPIAWNSDLTVLQTEIIDELGANKATVTGGPWPELPLYIEYDGDNAETAMPDVTATDALLNGLASGVEYDPLIAAVTQLATGPNHWSDGVNWSNPANLADHSIPGPGDTVYFTEGTGDVFYGLVQRVDFTVDTTNNYLIPAVDHDLLENQAVEVWTSSALPSGLSASTTYYVRDLDTFTGKFRVSATSGGTAIDITTSGTGTHTVGVRLEKLFTAGRSTSLIGLPWLNDAGYKEYRQQYLCIGMLPSGSLKMIIGEGEGAGSGRICINSGTDRIILEVLNTGSPVDSGYPSLRWIGNKATNVIKLRGGELGIACIKTETAVGDSIEQTGGTLTAGDVTFATYDQTGGELQRLDRGSFSGVVSIRQ